MQVIIVCIFSMLLSFSYVRHRIYTIFAKEIDEGYFLI